MINDKLSSTYLDAICDKVAKRTVELSGIPPLSFTAKGKPLTAWSITGNTVQNGTPTPENPVEVLGCGERTGNIVAAEANHINPMVGLSVVWKKGGSEMIINGKSTGGESARFATIELDAGTYTLSITGLDETGWSKTGFYLSGVDTARVQGERTYTITEPTSARLQFVVNASDVSYENRKVTIMFTKTSTALPYEPYGYKIPVVTKSDGAEPITTPIYLPTPLYSGEVMRSDGTITRTDGTTETFTAPQIPPLNGTTVIDVDTAVKPENKKKK